MIAALAMTLWTSVRKSSKIFVVTRVFDKPHSVKDMEIPGERVARQVGGGKSSLNVRDRRSVDAFDVAVVGYF